MILTEGKKKKKADRKLLQQYNSLIWEKGISMLQQKDLFIASIWISNNVLPKERGGGLKLSLLNFASKSWGILTPSPIFQDSDHQNHVFRALGSPKQTLSDSLQECKWIHLCSSKSTSCLHKWTYVTLHTGKPSSSRFALPAQIHGKWERAPLSMESLNQPSRWLSHTARKQLQDSCSSEGWRTEKCR